MSTVDTVFLIITACFLSLFFLLGSILIGFGIALVNKLKKLVDKAEALVDSVEDVAATLNNVSSQASGPLAILKVMYNITKLVNRKRK